MGETTVVTHLFVLGIIYIIISSILLIITTGINATIGAFDMMVSLFQYQYVLVPVIVASFYIIFFLFHVAYSIVTIIGAILGLLSKENIRKRGLIMLIVANLLLVPFFVVNCVLSITTYNSGILGGPKSLITIPASLGVVLCVLQFGLFVYSICHVIIVCMSFRNRTENRQAEEYQENELEI